MTYWCHAYCNDCKSSSPPLFVIFNGDVSLYPLDDKMKESAGTWLEQHSAPCHKVSLVHENDGNRLNSEPEFPYPDWGDEK